MIIFDKLIAKGVRFVLDKVTRAVDRELNDPDRLRERLLEAEARRDAGEIDDAEFAAVEREVLDRMRSSRGGDDIGLTLSSDSIQEIEVDADTGDEPAFTSAPAAAALPAPRPKAKAKAKKSEKKSKPPAAKRAGRGHRGRKRS